MTGRIAAGQEETAPVSVRIVVRYVLCFALVWLAPALGYRWFANELLPSFPEISSVRGKPEVIAKLSYYRAHRGELDLLFFGDSRTYCGMAPSRIDPLLGTRSLNLASFAHWFPTQYPNLQELLPLIPPGTTLVWSIGHQNFRRVFGEVGHVFPIGLTNVPTYLGWGFPWPSIRHNVIDGLPGAPLFSRRAEIRSRVDGALSRELAVWPSPPPTRSSLPAHPEQTGPPARIVERELARWRARPETVSAQPVRRGSHVTSLEVYERGGNYVRVELDPPFFREQQRLEAIPAAASEARRLATVAEKTRQSFLVQVNNRSVTLSELIDSLATLVESYDDLDESDRTDLVALSAAILELIKTCRSITTVRVGEPARYTDPVDQADELAWVGEVS